MVKEIFVSIEPTGTLTIEEKIKLGPYLKFYTKIKFKYNWAQISNERDKTLKQKKNHMKKLNMIQKNYQLLLNKAS